MATWGQEGKGWFQKHRKINSTGKKSKRTVEIKKWK